MNIIKKIKEVSRGYTSGPIFYTVLVVVVLGILVMGITLAIRGCSTNEPAVVTLERDIQETRETITRAQSTTASIGRGIEQGTRLNRAATFAVEGAGTRLQHARNTAREIEKASAELSKLIREIEKNNKNAK